MAVGERIYALMIDKNSQGRIVVAMSGGVDYAATAPMLKEQGLDVVGVTHKL